MNTQKGIYIGIGLLSLIAPIFPLSLLVIPMFFIFTLIKNKPSNQLIYYLFIIVLISGIWGPYLGIPQIAGFNLFKILMFVHLFFFLTMKKDFSKLKKMQVPLFLFVLWMIYSIISMLWSASISLSIEALYYQFESFYLLFMTIYYIDSEKKLYEATFFILLNYLIIISYSLYEVQTGNHLIYSAGNLRNYLDTRPTGVLRNTNDFAAFVGMYLAICCPILLRKRKLWAMIFFAVMMLVDLYIVIETHSRTGFLILIFIIALISYKTLKSIDFIISLYLLTAFLVIKNIYGRFFGSVVDGALVATFTEKGNSTEERFHIYRSLWDLAKENFFTGVGVGNTPSHVYTILNGTTNLVKGDSHLMGAHNFFLSVFSDVGFIGFLPLLLFFVYFFVESVRTYVHSESIFSFIPLVVFISFIGVSIGSSSIFSMRVVWIGLGIAFAVISVLKNKNISQLEGGNKI